MLNENPENKDTLDTLDPIREENQLESESCATNNTYVDAYDDKEDAKYQFPDTQIKIDLSGSK